MAGAEEGGWDIERLFVGRRFDRRVWKAERWVPVAEGGRGSGEWLLGSVEGSQDEGRGCDAEVLSWWS